MVFDVIWCKSNIKFLISKQNQQIIYVQNLMLSVGRIVFPHLGHVFLFQGLIWLLPQLRHSLPAKDVKEGAESAMTPPTTKGWMVLQSGQVIISICCPMNPLPS
jgi:hypothetical protein